MRTLTIFTLLILLSLNSFADAGQYFRFKVQVKRQDNSEITGYIYFGSYNPRYNRGKESFTEYVKREMIFPIIIYMEIKTVEMTGNNQNDFAISDNFREVKLAEISTINLIEELEYPAGQRLVKVNEKEYRLIKSELKYQGSIYNEKLSENCAYNLLCWHEISDFDKIRNEITQKVEELIDSENSKLVYKFIDTKQKELAEKGILLFRSCSAL